MKLTPDKTDKNRWLAHPATPAQAELRQALDHAAGREADEVALRRVWSRLAELPLLVPEAGGERDPAQQGHFDQVGDSRGRRVRWPWIVAASLAGATATLAFMLVETKSEFRAERHGAVTAIGTPATATTVQQRSTLVAPATVRTAFGETLHLSLRGGTEAKVTSESTLVLDRDDRPAVTAGEVQFSVPRQARGETFAVTAGSYRVVVVGTRFNVRMNNGAAAVAVEEGVVEIWTDHRIARVTSGESWVAPAVTTNDQNAATGTAATVPAGLRSTSASDSFDLADLAEPKNRTASPVGKAARNGAYAASTSARSSRRALSTTGYAAKGVRRVLALSSPAQSNGASFNTMPASASELPYASPLPSGGKMPARDSSAALAPPSAAPSAAPPAPAAVEVTPPLALQARAARAAGDSRRALGLYRALAQKGGAAGENAAYEIGRVLRDGLQQPREAVATWRLYRAQHPRGLLRIEADISVIETLVAMGEKTAAVAEASDFMRRYPDSERRAEIARLAGDLFRERGDCTDAIAAYEIALGNGQSRRDVADGATFHRATCVLRDKRAEGVAALQGYLVSFPAGRFRGEAQRLLGGVDSTSANYLSPSK